MEEFQNLSAEHGPLGGIPCALLHSRVAPEDKVAAMEGFKQGRVKVRKLRSSFSTCPFTLFLSLHSFAVWKNHAQVLVCTTVIEVGIDIPEASIIVVEHAERYGMAQLHQLRGRVGRGHRASHCMLLATEASLERLKPLERSQVRHAGPCCLQSWMM